MWANRSTSKYGNTRTSYGGREFSSKREAEHAMVLDALKRAKDPKQRVVEIDYQHRMPLVVNGQKVCTYVCDFRVTFADGHIEIHDAKGYATDVYKLKKKLVQAVYGVTILEF